MLAMNLLDFDFGNLFFNIISLRFDLLNFGVLRQHATNCNGHHFTISKIIHMTSHNCPANNTLHMIKHDPSYYNPNFGLVTKAKACKDTGQEGSPGVWESVRMNIHTPM
jgi:hypothetical protein